MSFSQAQFDVLNLQDLEKSKFALDGNGNVCIRVLGTGAGGGATQALDNLDTVAINAALVLGTSDAFALGSASKQWSDLFLAEGGVINWDNGDVTITQNGNILSFAGAVTRYEFDGNITPSASDGAALGTAVLMFSDIFLASGAVVNFNNGDVTLTHSADTITLAGGDLLMATSLGATGTRVLKGWFTNLESANAPTVGGVAIPTQSSTDTYTNKRNTKRVGSTTSSATPTINTDNFDIYKLTAQAVDITSFTTNLSGTPTDGQTLLIQITGTATRAIAWGAKFESSTVSFPTTTSGTNMLEIGFRWNTATSKWRCIGYV